MILVTVGTQLPFDRLIRAIDNVALGLSESVFAQIGKTSLRPQNIDFANEVEPSDFDQMARDCSRIVGHAGIGTVLLARRYRKPIILLARRAALSEHRTDHQVATANALKGSAGVYIAEHEGDLEGLLTQELDVPLPTAEYPGRRSLNELLTNFINNGSY